MQEKTENAPISKGAEPFHLAGKKAKILLIHGFTATPTEMRPIGEYLHAKGYDIYSVLLAGHGTTPEDLQKKKWKDWWHSAEKAFTDIDNCDFVIGFSMGALLAARLAVEYQKQLKGVVLLSTFLKIKPTILSSIAFLLPLIQCFKPYLSKSSDSAEFFKKHNLISYLRYPMKAVHESIKLAKITKRRYLPKITIPTLIIQGLKDDRVDPQQYQTLEEKIPAQEKELVLLPNSKHIVTVGPDTDLLLTSIEKFIEKYNK
ncbi:MAG: alpha/beta fold hydrolase [Asgard group archaeon]|nr:alpha/beta fold hydrolase [Asgard group archaeon]